MAQILSLGTKIPYQDKATKRLYVIRRLNNALKFVDNKYINLTGTPLNSYLSASNDFTITFDFLRTQEADVHHFLMHVGLDTNVGGVFRFFYIGGASNAFTYEERSQSGVYEGYQTAAVVPVGTQSRVTMSRQHNPSTTKVYQEGVPVFTFAEGSDKSGLSYNTTNNLSFGSPVDFLNFCGYVARVVVYNRVLTDAEVLQLNHRDNVPLISAIPGLIAYYKVSEKNEKTLFDGSGQNSHGTLINYNDAETASNGQPQSGNTAWVNAYSLLPITE